MRRTVSRSLRTLRFTVSSEKRPGRMRRTRISRYRKTLGSTNHVVNEVRDADESRRAEASMRTMPCVNTRMGSHHAQRARRTSSAVRAIGPRNRSVGEIDINALEHQRRYTGGVSVELARRGRRVLSEPSVQEISCNEELRAEQASGFSERSAGTGRQTCLLVSTHEMCVQAELPSQTESIRGPCSARGRCHPNNKKIKCSWLYGTMQSEGRGYRIAAGTLP